MPLYMHLHRLSLSVVEAEKLRHSSAIGLKDWDILPSLL